MAGGSVRHGTLRGRGGSTLTLGSGAIARALRCLGVACLVVALAGGGTAGADSPVVRALLFYLPGCGHCEKVMTVDLPPLVAAHGDALRIAIIDVSLEQGAALYEAAVTRYGLEDRRGVPALVVGNTALVGSVEIPGRLPSLIDELVTAGGTDWPDLPGLAAALGAAATVAPRSPSGSPPAEAGSRSGESPAPATTTPPAAVVRDPGPIDRLGRDPVGNGLAVIVLALMVVVGARAVVVASRTGAALVARPPSALAAVLAVVGLGIAGYLAFVEMTSVEAVCGPVGDCNTVQRSEFARLFGLVPIGAVGMAGFAAILVAFAVGTRAAPPLARVARVALLAMAFAGTAFSIYLTSLEPFVIGATCAWCLTSAVLMTAILALGVRAIPDAWTATREGTSR